MKEKKSSTRQITSIKTKSSTSQMLKIKNSQVLTPVFGQIGTNGRQKKNKYIYIYI
jgi:hypothetical protein